MAGHIEDYEVLEVIGTGSFGTCYKVRNKLSGEIFVWKAIDYGSMTEEKKQLLVSEVNCLSGLKHPNIVKYYDHIIHKESTTIYIIMEWCQGGDLATLIHKYKSKGCRMEEVFVWRVLYQTGKALQACHSHLSNVTVLHRDIKPANVFLDSSGNVKLGDFGLARILHSEESFSDTILGTPYYMSPERIKGSKYDRKSDIWALGCLVYALCALSPPFIGCDLNQLYATIKKGRFDPIPAYYSQDLQKIIELMLSLDHQFRPTIEMILHHPTVVLHISKRSSFKFGNKRDSLKAECDKATLALVSEKIKTLSMIDREPEEVSEDTFHEKWMVRLEALRQKEANLRNREDKLAEKERLILKKEKKWLHLERLSREKLIRAEVYLRQCKENRSSQVFVIPNPQKYKMIEELDTSLSADPGDTSILPTSTKLNPTFVPPPTNFVRSASERRCKHVHFDKSSKVSALSNKQEVAYQYKKVLGEIQAPVTNAPYRKALEDIQETEPVRLGALPKKMEKTSALKPILPPTLHWEEEKDMWLENKRLAYHRQLNKENAEQNKVYEVTEVKKRTSKLSLFTKKPSLR